MNTYTLLPLHDTEWAVAYTYDALDPDAQEKAWERWLEHTEVWLEPELQLEYYADEHLTQQGYDVDTDRKDISWNIGSYNGTDYFVFKAAVNVRQWLKHHKLSNKYRSLVNTLIAHQSDANVHISWSYGSYRSCQVYSESEWDLPYHVDPSPQADNELEQLEQLILEDAQDHMHSIQRDLTADYEYQLSPEYFAESCEANDYLFDEEGQLI